ncbi:MAG: S-layer homology domain-containing protein [Halanaerobiales bacterium]
MNYRRTFLLLVYIVFVFTISLQAAEPTDISNHWAQDYILNIVDREIMSLDADNRFHPDQEITRGEFARALARQMKLDRVYSGRFEDLENYPGKENINALVDEDIMTGYPDDTFKPDGEITRAEAVTVLIKALGIVKNEQLIELDEQEDFEEVPSGHWAEYQVKIAGNLGLLAVNGEEFDPGEEITRAEAARYLDKFENLESGTGYITDFYPTSERVSINMLDGERVVYDLRDDTLIGRNNRLVEIGEIQSTDKVFLVVDRESDELKYVKGYGMVTEDDMAAEVSTMTDGILSSDEVKTLSEGDLEILRPKLLEEVQEQLRSQGLSDEEVEAIVATDWDQLEGLSRERVAEAVAIRTGLPLDITRSVMGGDWEKIRSYAEIELVQRVVQEILNSELLS